MRQVTSIQTILFSFCWLSSFQVIAAGEAAEENNGLDIAKLADQRASGFGDSREKVRMKLVDRKGRIRIRQLELRTLERVGEGDWSIMLFHEPPDVDGTSLLTQTNVNRDDVQWIYLPALNRIKRISSRKKSGAFLGSEFAFEDLASFEIGKYQYRYLRDEPCGSDLVCTVVEQIPTYDFSGYSRLDVWQDTEALRTHAIDFFDHSGRHVKTLQSEGFVLYNNQYWRPNRSTMTNHITGRKTVMEFTNIQFGVGYTESDFTAAVLRRGR